MFIRLRLLGSLVAILVFFTTATGESTKSPAKQLGTHTGGIASVHFSANGKWLASAGGDKVIRLWNVEDGRLLHELSGPTSFACAVRFAPDDSLVAAAGYEAAAGNAIYLYDPATGTEVGRLAGHPTGGVRRLAFTPDSKQLVSAGFDGAVRVWDLTTKKELRSFKVEASTIYGLAVSPDGKLCATASREGLKLWDLTTGTALPRPAMGKLSCVSVCFSPDGKLIASGDAACVRLWEVATGKEVQTLNGFKGEVSQTVFSADGRVLYSGSYDRMVRLWEVRTGKMIFEAETHTGWVWGIALSPNEKTLASCSVDTKLNVWDLEKVSRSCETKAALSRKQTENHLRELASGDAAVAWKAVWALAGDPETSLPVLEDRLNKKKDPGPALAELNKLVADLDSDVYQTRKDAHEALASHGIHAMSVLQNALSTSTSPEVRLRTRRLLARLDPTELPPDDLVALRGVQALEYMGNAKAKKLLENLAQRETGRLGDEATRAVERLKMGRQLPQ
jgi:WD40 repeat protein